MKKKLAIITLYDDINFGNKLQNYATQEYFKSLGFEVYTIPYWERGHRKQKIDYYSRVCVHKFLQFLGFEKNKKKKEIKLKARRTCIKEFSSDYINLAPMIQYRKIKSSLKNEYDYFVTGSDQVWHCWYHEKAELEYFFLCFAKPEQRLTMSPSIGLNNISDEFKDVYINGFKGFNYISTREDDAAQLIKKISGKEAEVHLDPTMLVKEDVWSNILKKPINYCEGKYIIVYALGGICGQLKSDVELLAQKNNLKIINIADEKSSYYTSTRPDEFLYWIKNSYLVISDSFHATVFSILFRKNFIVFFREDTLGMENRLITLLEKFGLNNRIYTNSISFKEQNIFNIDFSMIDKVLDSERQKALNFYKKCLKNDCHIIS